MAIFATSDSFLTFWEITRDEQNYCEAKLSSSRKDKVSGEWKNSNWSFVRFVGQAAKDVRTLQPKDKITNVRFSMECEPYTDKTGQRVYPKSPRLCVFIFDSADVGRKPAGKAPVDEYEPDEDGLPF